MVEQQRRLSLPPGYKPPRKGPSRTRVLARRLAALAALLLVAAGGALFLITRNRETAAPPPPVVTAPPLRIIFPEGFTRRDMAERIEVVNGIALTKRKVRPKLSPSAYLALTEKSRLPGTKPFAGDGVARNLEGFLFPDTYEFEAKTPTATLIKQQLATFQANWKKVDLREARRRRLTGYDVLIVASMVEKEALVPEDRPKIAAVIYNRLRIGMALQIDATLRFGLRLPGTEPLSPHLDSDNPYNTRKYVGLPPTPIANPGLASIQAAAHPAKVSFIYFLAKPDKQHHYFTASYRDFVNKQREYGYID
jgi:UPF0755 protein